MESKKVLHSNVKNALQVLNIMTPLALYTKMLKTPCSIKVASEERTHPNPECNAIEPRKFVKPPPKPGDILHYSAGYPSQKKFVILSIIPLP